MLFEPGDHHVTMRAQGRGAFDVVGVDAVELKRAARELMLRGALHFGAAHLVLSPALRGALEQLVASAIAPPSGSSSTAASRHFSSTCCAVA